MLTVLLLLMPLRFCGTDRWAFLRSLLLIKELLTLPRPSPIPKPSVWLEVATRLPQSTKRDLQIRWVTFPREAEPAWNTSKMVAAFQAFKRLNLALAKE